MAGRFARSLDLARAAWSVVRADKELMLLPVLSVAALLLILGSLAVPVALLGGLSPDAVDDEPGAVPALGVLVFYIVAYFVTLFFNTALVGAAMIRMDGGNPRLGDGLRIAWERAGRIFGYACIAATVGLLLRALEQRIGLVGRIVVKLIGVGWALATFLVVPVLVTRDVGPVDAVKESAELLRRTWGENLIGNLGLGFVFGAGYFGTRDRQRRDPGAGGPDRPTALHFIRPARRDRGVPRPVGTARDDAGRVLGGPLSLRDRSRDAAAGIRAGDARGRVRGEAVSRAGAAG